MEKNEISYEDLMSYKNYGSLTIEQYEELEAEKENYELSFEEDKYFIEH